VQTTTLVHRLIASTAGAAALLVAAPAADGALVYVKQASGLHPQVWLARDGGGHARRLGAGTLPVISANGARVAWRTFGRRDAVFTAATAGGPVQRVVRGRDIGELALSPDGTRLAVGQRRSVVVYDTTSRKVVASVRGHAQGLSFSPDSTALALGLARLDTVSPPTDVSVLTLATGARTTLTTGGRALNPVWGPREIVFDRVTPRRRDAPTYQIRAVRPDGTGRRAITHLRIPSLLSGLVPIDVSADGRRLVAEFVGQDTSVGFTVNPATGRTRSLSRNQETGFVAAAIAKDGSTVLGSTGGADPTVPKDVVSKPYGGGRRTILVRDAAFPDWSR
jgi:WD40 repeat protein